MDHQPSGLDRRTLFKAGLGAASVAVVGGSLLGANAASAAEKTAGCPSPDVDFPWIIGCDGWSARPPSSTLTMSGNTTNKIIVHHMAFPNVTDYSKAHAEQLARDCQDLHMDTNGWSDTGQHFTVSRGGYIMEGRHRSVEGLIGGQHQVTAAHCPGENGNAIGIESEGTYVTVAAPEALVASVVKLCVAVCKQYGLHAHDIFGHWDFRETDCPGITYYRQFPGLRKRVMTALGTKPSDVPARRWPDIWRFVGGPTVRLAQYLLNFRGYSIALDGVWGDDTTAAIQDWQSKKGIPVDVDATMTGPTWETMAPAIASGATGNAVRGAQYILNHKGYSVTVTGTFDAATVKAVKAIQTLHGLPATGSVNASTWCAISGGIVRESFGPHHHHGHR